MTNSKDGTQVLMGGIKFSLGKVVAPKSRDMDSIGAELLETEASIRYADKKEAAQLFVQPL